MKLWLFKEYKINMTHTLTQIESSWKNTNNVRVMCKLHFPFKNYGNRKRTEKNLLFA